MAVRQDDGCFKLVGRIKEMYKSGGYNVYPREVELVLEQHPGVLLSAVIAVDDPLYQQVGHAHLIAKPRSEEHTSELQSLMRISYAVFCLKKKKKKYHNN